MFRFFRSREEGYNTVVTGSNPKKIDNLNNVRREDRRHFRNKKEGS
jgi:hypothetical protein